MHVEPHHVAQTVGHEKSMRTGSHGGVHVAFHQAEVLQPLGQHLADFKMHVEIGDTRAGNLDGPVVAGEDDIINIPLPLVETSANGHGSREIGAIIHGGFRPGIRQHHAADGERVAMIVVVERLPVLRKDNGEGHHATVGIGDALDEPGNIVLLHAGLSVLHGGHVHLVTNLASPVDFLYLARFLDGTQGNNGLNQFQ